MKTWMLWKQDIPVCRILKKNDLPYKSLGASDMTEGKKVWGSGKNCLTSMKESVTEINCLLADQIAY